MPRIPGAPRKRAAGRTKRIARTGSAAPTATGDRTASLEALRDHCAAALKIADSHGEKLLAYLLGMAELESAHAVRRHAVNVATGGAAGRTVRQDEQTGSGPD